MQFKFEAALFLAKDNDDEEDTGDCKNPMQAIGLGGDNEVGSINLMAGQTMRGTGFKAKNLRDFAEQQQQNLERSFDNYNGSHPPFPPIDLTTEDVTRYKMAWHALKFYRQPGVNKAPIISRLSTLHWHHYYLLGVVQRCTDWPDIEYVLELPIALGFTTTGMIYGGLHALAWFAHFESSTQQLLWRISACVVMSGFPVCWALVKSYIYTEINFPRSLHLDTIFVSFSLIALYLVALAYILARAYLVVECFINLSHLPAGVYDVPRWASYFPHIS